MTLMTSYTGKDTLRILVCAATLVVLIVGCSSRDSSLTLPALTESPVSAPTVFESPLLHSRAGRILYHSDTDGDFDIYVVDAAGTDVRQLTNVSGDDVEATWSPDGSQIAFSSKRDGNYEIYVMDADGGNQRRLTDDPTTDWGPTWSPDGGRIAFASDQNGEMHLFVMNSDGTDQHPLGPEAETAGWAPAWSPAADRDEIVFVSDRDGDSEIFLLELETQMVTQLTFNDRQDERPAWSPDGNQIVYMGAKENTSLFDPDEIYVMSCSGSEVRQLTDNLLGDITPTWSLDGYWIAFSSSRDGGWNIFVTPASGAEGVLQLTDNSAWDRAPCWGP